MKSVLLKFSVMALIAVGVLAIVPTRAGATAVSATSTTITSNNASTTLAKVGNTISFYLGLNNTPTATNTPRIYISSVAGSATTTMSGSGVAWTYSTTTTSGWTEGVITFAMSWGGTAGEATTTITQTSLTGANVTFDKTAPTGYSVTMPTYITATSSTSASFTFAGAQVGATYAAILGNGSASTTKTGTVVTATDQITGLNVSSLTNGTLTLNVSLTDPAGNQGSTTTATTILDTAIPAVPSASPSANSYSSAQSVTLTSSGSDSIVYTSGTRDIPTPTCSSGTTYSGAITVSSSQTIEAIACDTSGNASAVATFVYQISNSSSGGSSAGRTSSSKPAAKTPSVPKAAPIPVPKVGIPTSPVPVLAQSLRSGLVGEAVKTLQQMLNKSGFPVTTSGPGSAGQETTVFGPATRAAVIKFQLNQKIITSPTDAGAGEVGPMTRAKLNALVPNSVMVIPVGTSAVKVKSSH